MSDNKPQQPLSTEGIQSTGDGGFMITGRESINTYAFLALRGSVILRMKTGMSMLRNQEARMAVNYGWSKSTRFNGAKLLADLNKIGDEYGIARAKNDPTA
jgi:hypothetical protein